MNNKKQILKKLKNAETEEDLIKILLEEQDNIPGMEVHKIKTPQQLKQILQKQGLDENITMEQAENITNNISDIADNIAEIAKEHGETLTNKDMINIIGKLTGNSKIKVEAQKARIAHKLISQTMNVWSEEFGADSAITGVLAEATRLMASLHEQKDPQLTTEIAKMNHVFKQTNTPIKIQYNNNTDTDTEDTNTHYKDR